MSGQVEASVYIRRLQLLWWCVLSVASYLNGARSRAVLVDSFSGIRWPRSATFDACRLTFDVCRLSFDTWHFILVGVVMGVAFVSTSHDGALDGLVRWYSKIQTTFFFVLRASPSIATSAITGSTLKSHTMTTPTKMKCQTSNDKCQTSNVKQQASNVALLGHRSGMMW